MRHQNRKQTEANKLRQIEMVRRKYPQFDPERDYPLFKGSIPGNASNGFQTIF